MYGYCRCHRPAFLKPLTTFWTDAAFLYATLRILATCHVVTILPTCFLIHILSAASKYFSNGPKKASSKGWNRRVVCGGSETMITPASRAISVAAKNNSLLLRWFNKIYEMSQPTNKPLIGHPAFAPGGPPFVNSIFILLRLYDHWH